MKSNSAIACVGWVLFAAAVIPVQVQAQFTFTTNAGAITITGYTGPGGVVVIPSTTNSLPVTGLLCEQSDTDF